MLAKLILVIRGPDLAALRRKPTLARKIGDEAKSSYLDLESQEHRAKLAAWSCFLIAMTIGGWFWIRFDGCRNCLQRCGYVDLPVALLLAPGLRPFSTNAGKRLVKAWEVYVRGSGLVRALSGIGGFDVQRGHPVAGVTSEGFAIENLIAAASARTMASFSKTAPGTEVNFLLEVPGHGRVEVRALGELTNKMAVRVRFELTEPAKVQRFSRPPHSTTLPPHRSRF